MLSLAKVRRRLPVQETPVPVKPAKPLFGRVQSEAFYRMAKDFIFEHKLYRLLDIEFWDETEVYTLCNLWRVEKIKEDLICFEFCLKTKHWYEIAPENLPHMTLLHFKGESPANQLFRAMGHKLMEHFLDLGLIEPVLIRNSSTDKSTRLWEFIMTQLIKGLRRWADAKGGSRRVVKGMWKGFIDREVYSHYKGIKNWPELPYLDEYVMCYQHRKALLKVAREHANLLPLLRYIHPAYWGNKDLFAVRNWMPGSALMAEEGFYQQVFSQYHTSNLSYSGFKTKAAIKWLMKTDRSIVRRVVVEFETAANLIEILVRLQLKISARVFGMATNGFVRNLYDDRNFSARPVYSHVLRLFIAECSTQRKAIQKCDAREELTYQLTDIVRWLGQTEGRQGQIDRFSTWKSLQNRHDEWVDAMKIESTKQYEWASLLNECEIENFVIKPLTSSTLLYEEGKKMRHCVASYDTDCFKGRYQVFALHDPASDQDFTLGLYLHGNQWEIDQIRSHHNSQASAESIEIAVRILALVNQKQAGGDSTRPYAYESTFEEIDELEGFMEG